MLNLIVKEFVSMLGLAGQYFIVGNSTQQITLLLFECSLVAFGSRFPWLYVVSPGNLVNMFYKYNNCDQRTLLQSYSVKGRRP